MDSAVKEEFTKAGFNIDTAITRFLNSEEMYFEFLKKFLEDDLIFKIKECIDNKDTKSGFEAAHTLKGLCANLSMDSINAILNPMVEVFRSGEKDGMSEEMWNNVTATYSKLLEVYKNVEEVIKKYC